MSKIKKLLKDMLIIILIISAILPQISYGYTVSEIGSSVAGFAKNFITEGNAKDILRYAQIRPVDGNMPQSNGLYVTDCSGFVYWVYEQVCGITYIPTYTGSYPPPNFSGTVIGSVESLQAGDILWRSEHVGIYNGDGTYSHSSTSEAATTEQMKISTLSGTFSGFTHYYRLTNEGAEGVTSLDETFSVSGYSSDTSNSEFYYTGIPEGKYTLTNKSLDWLIESLSQIADYIIGFATMGIRIVFVGWTALFEYIITATFEATTGVAVDGVDSVKLNGTSNKLTLESIVFNKVPILDINIFDYTMDDSVTGTGSAKTIEE